MININIKINIINWWLIPIYKITRIIKYFNFNTIFILIKRLSNLLMSFKWPLKTSHGSVITFLMSHQFSHLHLHQLMGQFFSLSLQLYHHKLMGQFCNQSLHVFYHQFLNIFFFRKKHLIPSYTSTSYFTITSFSHGYSISHNN